MMSDADTEVLEGLLRWYAAMGVDAVVDEHPHDRFETHEPMRAVASEAVSAETPSPLTNEPAPSVPWRSAKTAVPADDLIHEAHASATGARDVADLERRWAALPGCSLAASATRMVMADGTAGSRAMLIAGAPEADDERQGRVLAGDRGRLLDAMLAAVGLDRTQVYLANLVPWRPPGARAPTTLELALCLPFARRLIALADPHIVVCLGERAAHPLLDSREPLSRLRGRWLSLESEGRTVKAMVSFSPDYLLKQPLQKRRAWSDLQMLAAALAT